MRQRWWRWRRRCALQRLPLRREWCRRQRRSLRSLQGLRKEHWCRLRLRWRARSAKDEGLPLQCLRLRQRLAQCWPAIEDTCAVATHRGVCRRLRGSARTIQRSRCCQRATHHHLLATITWAEGRGSGGSGEMCSTIGTAVAATATTTTAITAATMSAVVAVFIVVVVVDPRIHGTEVAPVRRCRPKARRSVQAASAYRCCCRLQPA